MEALTRLNLRQKLQGTLPSSILEEKKDRTLKMLQLRLILRLICQMSLRHQRPGPTTRGKSRKAQMSIGWIGSKSLVSKGNALDLRVGCVH